MRLQVDGELWDLERPLEKSVSLELLDFEHPEGAYMPPVDVLMGANLTPQARRFSGIPLPMFSAKLPNVIMVVTYAMVPLPTKVSSMKWIPRDQFLTPTIPPWRRWRT